MAPTAVGEEETDGNQGEAAEEEWESSAHLVRGDYDVDRLEVVT